MRLVRLAFAFALVLAAPTPASPGKSPRPAVEVESFGALMDVIHKGQRQGRVPLSSALARPHAWALGAMAGLDGEFAILDGATWVTRPHEDGTLSTVAAASPGDSATLMVVSHVAAWRERRLESDLPLAALQDTVAALGAALGLPAGGPFPFVVEGPLRDLDWHVVDGHRLAPGPSSHEAHQAASVHGHERSVEATLVGFYSDHHRGVFTHHDSNLHLHAVLGSPAFAAHVDSVVVARGAVLRLPSVVAAAPRAGGSAAGSSVAAVARRYAVTADASGFHPDRIVVPAGRPVTLVVTRTTDRTCATEVVLASRNLRWELPLNRPVEIVLDAKRKGEIRFACGMDMWKGAIVVE